MKAFKIDRNSDVLTVNKNKNKFQNFENKNMHFLLCCELL